ncbi:hypothetical protein [Nocardia sp. NPDC004860]|uniref:hypothetical protein n=1 Tax=Nocardia sp. NPDC004860 TaxID=3154557 RepID=UPI0033AFDBAD
MKFAEYSQAEWPRELSRRMVGHFVETAVPCGTLPGDALRAVISEHHTAVHTSTSALLGGHSTAGDGLRDRAGYQLRQQFQLPSRNPFDGLRERTESAVTIYQGARSRRLEQYAQLQQQYNELDGPSAPCVIHDDAWQGNLVIPPSGSHRFRPRQRIGWSA